MKLFKKSRKNEISLEEVTEILSTLRLPIALVFTPTNLESEKKKFFESNTYNPQFKYEIVKNDNESVFKKLEGVTGIMGVDPRISEFYMDLIESKKRASALMHSAGNNEEVTRLSIEQYGFPTHTLFRNAGRIIRGLRKGYSLVNKEKDEDVLNYEQIERVFRAVFDELGLDEWSIDKSAKIASNGVKVAIKRRQVLMDPNITRTISALKKTIVHEVGAHVLRTINGEKSGFAALGKANLPLYLDAEEGIATLNEEQFGVLTYYSLRKKAVLAWAVYVGKDMSFRQLYNALSVGFKKTEAFDITYRIKRGLGDTSKPGAYVKDIVYFRGFKKVRKKISEDSTAFNNLYAGKISLKQIRWVEDGLLPKPKIVFDKKVFERAFKKAGI
jgi:hypothetical protein